MTKDERQQLTLERWVNSSQYGSPRNFWGTLVYPTGMGKTHTTATRSIKYYIDNVIDTEFETPDTAYDVLVITPLFELVKDWQRHIDRLPEKYKKRITIKTIHSLIAEHPNWEESDFVLTHLLVIDEIHMFYPTDSMERWYLYANGSRIKCKALKYLTATPHYKDKRHQTILERAPIFDVVTESEAIENGWIVPYLEYNIPVVWTPEETEQYEDIQGRLQKYAGMLDNEKAFILATNIISGGYYKNRFYEGFKFAISWAKQNGWKAETESDEFGVDEPQKMWSPGAIMKYAKEYLKAIRERTYLLSSMSDKEDLAYELAHRYVKTGDYVLILSDSVVFVDNLAARLIKDGIKACSLHSRIPSQGRIDPETNDYYRYKSGKKAGQIKMFSGKFIRNILTEKVKKGEIQVLCATKVVKVGVDLDRFGVGIFASRYKDKNDHVQRVGRPRGGKREERIIINLYVPYTVDEAALKSSQTGREVYYLNNINQIVDTKPDFNP